MYITFPHMYMFTCVFFFSDNDECSLRIDDCVQTCTNTEGNFFCGCNTGFQLNSDRATCDGEYYMKHTHVYIKEHNMYVQNHTYISNHVDNDDCSDGTHDCSQTCINTVGSFTCGCGNGYLLDKDKFTCNGCTNLRIFMIINL